MCILVSMFIDLVPNRNSPPAILLRESFREGSKVKKRTIANLSSWPGSRIEVFRRLLRGELDSLPLQELFQGPIFGVLFVFAIASLGVYGIVIAGWSSNSKYPFLGGVRSSSQMISYELSLGLAVIPIFLVIGQLRLTEVVRYQIEHGWMIAPFIGDWTNAHKWLLAIPMLVSFVVFMIAIFAETNRLPFDLPEAETELVGGYNTEYGSMKFGLFFLGEYIAMITGSAIIVTLFLGGWHFPGIPDGSHGWGWGLVNIFIFANFQLPS